MDRRKLLTRTEEGERLRALGLVPSRGEHPTADQLRERLRAAGVAPIAGASEFNDARTLFVSAARAAATYTYTNYARDHHNGLYILVDVTNANGGTVTPRASLKSNINPADSKVIYQSQVAANANGAWVYLLYPAGIEGVTAAVTPNERVSLPMPQAIDIGFVVAAATVTFSAETFGLAL